MSEQHCPIHPYAELFPPMTLAEFERLCDDIQQNGLLEEIVLHEGKVLEGRSRYWACLARGVAERFRPYAGECGSPLAFVVARNLHRRHLSESQRALVAARLKPRFEEEARQRQTAALKRGSDLPVGQNFVRREKHEENCKSAWQAAELMKVSHTCCARHGSPDPAVSPTAGLPDPRTAARRRKPTANKRILGPLSWTAPFFPLYCATGSCGNIATSTSSSTLWTACTPTAMAAACSSAWPRPTPSRGPG